MRDAGADEADQMEHSWRTVAYSSSAALLQ